METGPRRIARLAAQMNDENFDFRYFIKNNYDFDDPELQSMVNEITAYFWDRISCKECANCCRILKPLLTQRDIQRLASRLDIEEQEFIDRYLEDSAPGDEGMQIRQAPCPFLQNKQCSVYEDRPAACRGYPYLDKDIVSRMLGVIERASECPVVFNVMEQLKKRTGFRP